MEQQAEKVRQPDSSHDHQAVQQQVLEETPDAVGVEPPAAQAAVTVVVGVPVWVAYRLMGLSRTRGTPLWFVYVLPVGVGGSLALAVVGASAARYRLLVWVVDDVVAAVNRSQADAVTVLAGPAGLETIGMARP